MQRKGLETNDLQWSTWNFRLDPLACRLNLYWRGHTRAMHWRYKKLTKPYDLPFFLRSRAFSRRSATLPDQVIIVLSAIALRLLQLFVSSAVVLQGSLSVSKIVVYLCKIPPLFVLARFVYSSTSPCSSKCKSLFLKAWLVLPIGCVIADKEYVAIMRFPYSSICWFFICWKNWAI